MKKHLWFWIFILVTIPIHSQDTTGYDLIAHFPLQTDGHDATGNYPGAELVDIVFQNGAAYSAGVYNSGGIYETRILTPLLNTLDADDFMITLEVNPDTVNIPSVNSRTTSRCVPRYP